MENNTKPKYFIDCGAHCGESILRAKQQFGQDTIVISFEGVPQLAEQLQKLYKNDPTVTINNKAVWTEDGEIEFNICPSFTDGSSILNTLNNNHLAEKIKVPSFDLSQWIIKMFKDSNIYLILKLDIEGAEYDVLQKMCDDGSINLVDELWGEYHYNHIYENLPEEKREAFDQKTKKVLKLLTQNNITFKIWEAYYTNNPMIANRPDTLQKPKKMTFCIPTKNNLRYLKNSIESIKQNSVTDYEIIVYIDSDNDGTENWLKENNITYLKNETNVPKGIAYGYNRCIESSTTPIVCMFHADMYMAKGFDTGILKYLRPLAVISGTRIEPPLHPKGKEKIVKDFGIYPEDFKKEDFDAFVENCVSTSSNKLTKGIFAPWAIYKEDIISIGMHDEFFHSYHEDSDIFNRFILNGYEIAQTWEAYVYHLTCRGGQFQDGIEKVTTDEAFHTMKTSAAKNYLRKWGSWVKNDEFQYPIIQHKYNIAFVITNCQLQHLQILEPWCDRIYVDNKWDYIETEQPNTKFDLKKRVLSISDNNPIAENDIILTFNTAEFTQNSFNIIQQLSDIITESGEIGEFELDCFKIKINALTTYEKDLIFIK